MNPLTVVVEAGFLTSSLQLFSCAMRFTNSKLTQFFKVFFFSVSFRSIPTYIHVHSGSGVILIYNAPVVTHRPKAKIYIYIYRVYIYRVYRNGPGGGGRAGRD